MRSILKDGYVIIYIIFKEERLNITPKGIRTKTRIIETAVSLIKRKGLGDVTLSDICSEADVAPGTFYHYFSTMNEILFEILAAEGQELETYHAAVSEGRPDAVLALIIEFQISYFEKKGKDIVSRLYSLEMQTDSGLPRLEDLLPFRTILTGIIDKGRNSGCFRKSVSPETAAEAIAAFIAYYSMQWLHDKEGRTLEQMLKAPLQELLENMLLTPLPNLQENL